MEAEAAGACGVAGYEGPAAVLAAPTTESATSISGRARPDKWRRDAGTIEEVLAACGGGDLAGWAGRDAGEPPAAAVGDCRRDLVGTGAGAAIRDPRRLVDEMMACALAASEAASRAGSVGGSASGVAPAARCPGNETPPAPIAPPQIRFVTDSMEIPS